MTNTEKCRNADESPCGGEVFERWSRSGMTSTVRCDVHQRAHDEILDGIANRYPDTSVAPDWFDESYAGERWDSDY
jgi:hypothetical protein